MAHKRRMIRVGNTWVAKPQLPRAKLWQVATDEVGSDSVALRADSAKGAILEHADTLDNPPQFLWACKGPTWESPKQWRLTRRRVVVRAQLV